MEFNLEIIDDKSKININYSGRNIIKNYKNVLEFLTQMFDPVIRQDENKVIPVIDQSQPSTNLNLVQNIIDGKAPEAENKACVMHPEMHISLTRCPECGQAHSLIIVFENTGYLLRKDYQVDDFGIINERPIIDGDIASSFKSICCDGIEPKIKRDYYSILQNTSFEDDQLLEIEDNTMVLCPVCYGVNDFSEWKEAWENPNKFFKYKDICEACGGECIYTTDSNLYPYEMICESCGLQHKETRHL